ncbi:betaine/proline/choline family ABC transporter ATP-binding protein [Taklimakanibacter deserti]|uniref:betaine/proline/choline family ABC transporter ATP-binding protein n=1 Tax=Taklimakanibacter deserti TaxID=2267839 RepID=UPI0034D776DF
MTPTPAVECRGVWKVFGAAAASALAAMRQTDAGKDEIKEKFGSVVAVADATFSVRPGEIFCIMGLSGSGKSTLLRHINGLVRPTAGEVLIDGEDIAKLSTSGLRDLRARKIGMVFQNFALLPHRSVLENVAFGLELRDVPEAQRQARAREVLDAVQLEAWAGSSIGELSGGMQQRVGLARALAGDPDILLMDEPFGALDPLIRRELQDQFLGLCRGLRKTSIFITHDLDEAMRIGSRIAIMRDGRLLQTGAPHEIIMAPADSHVAAFVRDVSSRDTLNAGHVMSPLLPTERAEIAIRAGVRPDTLLSETARMAARETGDLPVRDGDGMIIGVVRIPDMLAALAGRGARPDESGSHLERRTEDKQIESRGRTVRTLGAPAWSMLALLLAAAVWWTTSLELPSWLSGFPVPQGLDIGAAEIIDAAVGWMKREWVGFFDVFTYILRAILNIVEAAMVSTPWPLTAGLAVILAWRLSGLAAAAFTASCLAYLGLFGFWEKSMSTLALVASAVLICVLFGLPLGILCAKSVRSKRLLEPVMDVMQTLPTFVYLIPAVAFFSIGKPPGVIATVIFALPSMVRLTALGIEQVPATVREAADAFGARPLQKLMKVELPLALPSIRLGINQTIMMSLSMVVVAAMIGAGGLGLDVIRSLQHLKTGQGFLAGLAIVLCAMALDRMVRGKPRGETTGGK